MEHSSAAKQPASIPTVLECCRYKLMKLQSISGEPPQRRVVLMAVFVMEPATLPTKLEALSQD